MLPPPVPLRVVAMIQSLVRSEKVVDLVANYGQVIVDDCHHLPAASIKRVLAEVKARCGVKERLSAIPEDQERLVLATGRYIGEGFDDARLDTLFLALPVCWKETLIHYASRLHRLHPRKSEIRIF
jgi:superfamily II DNA or RNA helicase